MTPPPSILILAAGASSRMRGADKLLEPVGGEPLILRIAGAALATGARVWITLPADRPARLRAVEGLDLTPVLLRDPGEGMSMSLRTGLGAMPDGPVMILLADLPEITSQDLATLVAASREAPDRICRAASASGVPGHPVVFPARHRTALLAGRGDHGARDLLRAEARQVILVPLPGDHATTDLDTPEDWAGWRSRNPHL